MRFVIIASPRTGSNHLVSLLNKQKNILCDFEIFHPKKPHINLGKRRLTPQAMADLAELRRVDPAAFMHRIFESKHGHAHVGFKIFRKHNDEVLRDVIADSSIRKIVLYRRNVLANYSSSLVARHTNTWAASAKSGPRPEPPKVQFKKKQFVKFHDKYVGFYCDVMNQINAERQDCHLINYEDVNNPWLFACLVNYIGGDAAAVELKGGQIRQNPSDIVSRFVNTEDVEEFLREKQLMHWANEGECTFGPLDAKPLTGERSNRARSQKQQASVIDKVS